MVDFIKYENIYLHFGDRLILKDLSGSLSGGSLYVVSGENGAGKTSFLNILAGKLAPARGRVLGPKFNRQSIRALIGSTSLYSHLSVFENLALFSDVAPDSLIESFGLRKFSDVLLRDLSQGYLQRVGLALTLSSRADMIILDEPTNFLDKESKRSLLGNFETLKKAGRSLILSSHEPELFNSLDPIFLELKGGQFVQAA